jgi:ABC-type multidrug transport system fused ATPase/permease subunit
MAFKSSSEFQCLLFEKLLKVSPSSMKERAESGEVTNFMQIDAHRLTFLMMSSPEVLTIPTNLVGYCYMLFKFFGLSFVFGIATLCLCHVYQFLIFKKIQKIAKKANGFKG